MKRMHEGYRTLNNRLADLHIAAKNLLLLFEERLTPDFALTSLASAWQRSCKVDLSILPEAMRTDAVTAIVTVQSLSRRVQSSLRRTKTLGPPPSDAEREAIAVLIRAQRYCGELASRSVFQETTTEGDIAATPEACKVAASTPTQKANEAMTAIYTQDRTSAGWKSQQWADAVGGEIDSSTIRKTPLWIALKAEREALKQSSTVKTRGQKPVKK